MLGKLLKYNLKDSYKFLIIFYSLSILGAILTRMISLINNSLIFDIIWQILSGFTISMMISMLINNIMRCWVRFNDTFYKDESYLTHTLPINKKTIFLSKFLNSVITLFTSILVILITLFIAYYSKNNLEILKTTIDGLANIFDTTLIGVILGTFLVLFLELLLGINTGITGIILGNKMNDKKTLFSIIFGFMVYIGYQMILLLVLFITALFNNDLMKIFTSNVMINFNIIKLVIILSIIFYSILVIINYFVGCKLIKNGVNVD